tara:strand:+ start:1579 stop:1797 length:219 start_codon:yes stop_codon:yes gene_type:complete
MAKVSSTELEASINELLKYRTRLKANVLNLAKRLKLPQSKIELTLKNHPELTKTEKLLNELTSLKESIDSNK